MRIGSLFFFSFSLQQAASTSMVSRRWLLVLWIGALIGAGAVDSDSEATDADEQRISFDGDGHAGLHTETGSDEQAEERRCSKRKRRPGWPLSPHVTDVT